MRASPSRPETRSESGVRGVKKIGRRLVREVLDLLKTLVIFVPFWFVFTSVAFELRSIPSESMLPALQVGDRVAVAKYAYGYGRGSLLFNLGRFIPGERSDDPDQLLFKRSPRRGDVVIFRHPHDDKVMIKRLIGLPGDSIQMIKGRLYINGRPVKRELERRISFTPHRGSYSWPAVEYRESLRPGESHLIQEFNDRHPLDDTPVFEVPDGHFFAMGDNRDNSQDSRAPSGHREHAGKSGKSIGFVPFDHLIGQGVTVLFTLHTCFDKPSQGCPKGRLWRGL